MSTTQIDMLKGVELAEGLKKLFKSGGTARQAWEDAKKTGDTQRLAEMVEPYMELKFDVKPTLDDIIANAPDVVFQIDEVIKRQKRVRR